MEAQKVRIFLCWISIGGDVLATLISNKLESSISGTSSHILVGVEVPGERVST